MNEYITTFRIFDDTKQNEFVNKGYKSRYFFPHETCYIPRCAMDGFYFANRMYGIDNPNSLWEIILYAREDLIDEFPKELFFDDEIIWHQEHFGRAGQIAAANLIIDKDKLYTLEHISDLVQRIHLRKEFRTRINHYFRYWHHMLLNSILNFAVENSLNTIYSPTADLLVEKYYPKVDRKLFDSLYDRDVTQHFEVDRKNGMWVIDVNKNLHKLIRPEKEERITKNHEKTICIFHDLERGYGLVDVDPALAEYANINATPTLKKMLRIERETNVRVTYNVVASFLKEVKEIIKKEGHCLAFHSYDHQISRQPPTNYMGEGTMLTQLSQLGYRLTKYVNKVRRRLSLPPISKKQISEIYIDLLNSVRKPLKLLPIINQLYLCQCVDYRPRGYRHYLPDNNSELNDFDLCYFNFDWIAVNEKRFGAEPFLENRVVKIPVSCDDSKMYQHNLPYEIWENEVIEKISKNNFTAVGLHDCFASYWLSHYSEFLKKISSLGQVKTFDEIANQVFLSNSI